MIEHHHCVSLQLNKAEAWLRTHRSIALPIGASIKDTMARPKSISSVWSWFSGLFMRDGRAMEFFIGVAIIGWALLSDILTDQNILTSSMEAAIGLLSPDDLVTIGYTLGIMQILALITLVRLFRAPVVFVGSWFLGVLTIGAWNGVPAHPPSAAFYGAVWAMEVYTFVRLCRPRA